MPSVNREHSCRIFETIPPCILSGGACCTCLDDDDDDDELTAADAGDGENIPCFSACTVATFIENKTTGEEEILKFKIILYLPHIDTF